MRETALGSSAAVHSLNVAANVVGPLMSPISDLPDFFSDFAPNLMTKSFDKVFKF